MLIKTMNIFDYLNNKKVKFTIDEDGLINVKSSLHINCEHNLNLNLIKTIKGNLVISLCSDLSFINLKTVSKNTAITDCNKIFIPRLHRIDGECILKDIKHLTINNLTHVGKLLVISNINENSIDMDYIGGRFYLDNFNTLPEFIKYYDVNKLRTFNAQLYTVHEKKTILKRDKTYTVYDCEYVGHDELIEKNVYLITKDDIIFGEGKSIDEALEDYKDRLYYSDNEHDVIYDVNIINHYHYH